MNNILKTIVFGGVALATLSSCSDFLDQKSPSDTDASNVWQSTYYTQNVLNKAYGLLCEDYTYSQVFCYTFMTNTDIEFANAYGEGNAKAEGKGRDLNNYYADNDASFQKSRDAWDHIYESIEYCNNIIEGLKGISPETTDKTEKQLLQYKGEALTLRAMLYHELVRNWGDVPFKTEPTKNDLSNINTGKTDRDVIMDALIADREEAINYLPWAGQSGYTTEHMTKGYAHALLAQIALQRSGWAIREAAKEGYVTATENSDPTYPTQRCSDADRTKYYQLALTHLNAVISSGKHKLNPSFDDEWTLINKQILDTQYQENLFEVAMGLGNSSELGYGIGVRFADQCAYALKGNSSANVQLPSTLFWMYDHSGKDTRRDVTCSDMEIKVDNGVTTETMLGNKPFNIYCGKWDVRKFSDDWSAMAKVKGVKFGTGINFVKLRYSQVLLWYAEIMNELNGNPDVATGGCGMTARQALAEVHKRAYADADKSVAQSYIDAIPSDKDAFFNAIVDENALEFAGEGVRKYELERWNLLSAKIDQMKEDYKTQIYEYPEKLYYKTYTENGLVKIDMKSIRWYDREAPENAADYKYVTFWGDEGKESNVKKTNVANLEFLSGGLNLTVKNRYLLPIYSSTINESEGSLQNSYGFIHK